MERWQLGQARTQLSRVLEQAIQDGPQMITQRGKGAVVVIAAEEYRRLASAPDDLVDFFQASPLVGEDLDLERSSEPGRDIDL